MLDFLRPRGVFSHGQFLLANLLWIGLVYLLVKLIVRVDMEHPAIAVSLVAASGLVICGLATAKRLRALGHSGWWGLAALFVPLIWFLLLFAPDRENRL